MTSDATLRRSLNDGRDIIWLPQAGWTETAARKRGGWWVVATHSERMVTCGGVCAKTFSVEGPSGGHCGRLVTNTAGSKTWVCKECLNFRKRKHLPNHEDSDLENPSLASGR